MHQLKVESNQTYKLIQCPPLRDDNSKQYEIEKKAQEAVCNLHRLTHDPSGNTVLPKEKRKNFTR